MTNTTKDAHYYDTVHPSPLNLGSENGKLQ